MRLISESLEVRAIAFIAGVFLVAGSLSAQITTREDFTKFAADPAKLASLRKAVAAMMALDNGKADKDLSGAGWKYQAYIHGVSKAVLGGKAAWTADEVKTWNTCQHSTWFFLAWHRMELYYFERTLRVMADDPKLSLPYWNFSLPDGKDPTVGAKLPPEFRVKPTDAAPNSLWWTYRNADLNKPPGPGAMDNAKPLDGKDSTTLNAFKQTDFFTNTEAKGPSSFGGGATDFTQHGINDAGTGQIEQTPHNSVHGAVGNGDVLSMSNAAGSGFDPIFWPIHANLDRAWACWQEKHPGSEPKAGLWLTQKFYFVDVTGTPAAPKVKLVTLTGKEIIDAAKLNYAYDDNCAGFQIPAPAPAPKVRTPTLVTSAERGTSEPVSPISASADFDDILTGAPVTLKVPVSQELRERIAAIAEDRSSASVFLSVGGMAVDELTGAAYGIYVGLPEGKFPDQNGPYYAGRLAFFGVGHHRSDDVHQDHTARYDVTDAIKQMMDIGDWNGTEIPVTIANTAAYYPDRVTAPPATADKRARFSSVRITVQ